MYARSFDKDRRSIQVPEHYSGSLFAEHTPMPSKVEVDSPERKERPQPKEHHRIAPSESKKEGKEHSLPSLEIHETVQNLVDKISAGLGFDRLLILGLMLLLSGVDGSSELILWLALLLFV